MSSSEVENVRKGAFGNDFYIGDFKLSMWIPAELGGKVIGVKGIIISNLKTETKCKLIKAMKPVGQSLWTAVVIIGDAFKCQSAYNAVAGIVSGGKCQHYQSSLSAMFLKVECLIKTILLMIQHYDKNTHKSTSSTCLHI